jgi:hypothetical protein
VVDCMGGFWYFFYFVCTHINRSMALCCEIKVSSELRLLSKSAA